MAQVERTRNWTFIMYPDSMPEDWREIINDWHIPAIVSPLHDRDINPTGERKKSHYHVILGFDGKKSYNQIVELIEPLNCTIPKKVNEMGAMVRYLCHVDNPEKAQYDKKDLIMFSGFDVEAYLLPTRSQRYIYINEMCEWIKNTGCIEFRQLVDHARYRHYSTWYPLLTDSCSTFMQRYVTSCRNENLMNGKLKDEMIDLDTGEVYDV